MSNPEFGFSSDWLEGWNPSQPLPISLSVGEDRQTVRFNLPDKIHGIATNSILPNNPGYKTLSILLRNATMYGLLLISKAGGEPTLALASLMRAEQERAELEAKIEMLRTRQQNLAKAKAISDQAFADTRKQVLNEADEWELVDVGIAFKLRDMAHTSFF